MNKRTHGNERGALLTYQQVADESNLGISTVQRLARESGALVKIGRIARIDPTIFFQYLEENCREKGE